MPGAHLVAVVDRDLEQAKAIAAEYGCDAYRDADALLGKVQAASVAVPTVSHREVAEPLLEAGVDVLIEKPLARSVEEADAINATADRNSRLVMVGHSERFNPAVMVLAREVESPRFFEIHRLAGFSARSTDIDVILDLMIHDLDLLLHLDGSTPVSIDAVGVNALTDRVDIANASRRVRVFQERTYLSCDTGQRKVERYRLVPGDAGTPRIEHDVLPVAEGEPLGLEIAAFLESVRSRTTPPVDGRQGGRVLELAHRVLSSIHGN